MKRFGEFLAAVCASSLICAGCDRKQAVEHEDSNWAVTAWGEQYEVFAECEPLIAGSVAKSHTHVTVLCDFSALRGGVVSAVLRPASGAEQIFKQQTPVRDGIFSIELQPTEVGEFALSFRVEGAEGAETIDAGRVKVGTADSAGGLVQGPVYGPDASKTASEGQAVSFLKEQQWRTPFHTEWAREGVIQGAVQGPARVRPAAGAEAVLTAPLDGIVGVDSRWYVGLEVAKGAILMRLAPRAASNRTLAEVEADTDMAKRRLARLEELLKIEAVSSAEVEEARARLAALESQSQAAKGAGGTKTPVRAPFSGEIAEVHVIPGQAVSAGDPLVRMIRRTPLWFEVALLPSEAARLPRAPSGLVVKAPETSPLLVPGEKIRLVSLSPEVDPVTGKVTAILEVAEPLPVQVGTVVGIEILLSENREGIVIPASGVIDDSGVSIVYVQVDGESFARRPVEVLGRQAERVLVSGVQSGDRVVTEGGGTIRRQAMMATGPAEGHVH